jgi:methyl halide transferase
MIDWEERYQLGDTPWDKGGPHPALTGLGPLSFATSRVLVPGCGLGYDVALWAGMPGVEEVVGIDVAETAVAAARKRLSGTPSARVELADLFALPPKYRGYFDLVWEHTCFCAIDPSKRQAYVDAVAGALKPGGHLLAVFYLSPWDTAEENAALGPPFATSPEELDRRLAPRFATVSILENPATYAGREGREQLRLLRRS